MVVQVYNTYLEFYITGYEEKFFVLAFPCNQFGEQEPEESKEIVENMVTTYDVEFPIFGKIDVIGKNASPAFKNLIGLYFFL